MRGRAPQMQLLYELDVQAQEPYSNWQLTEERKQLRISFASSAMHLSIPHIPGKDLRLLDCPRRRALGEMYGNPDDALGLQYIAATTSAPACIAMLLEALQKTVAAQCALTGIWATTTQAQPSMISSLYPNGFIGHVRDSSSSATSIFGPKLTQAALWGFMRVAAHEYPSRCWDAVDVDNCTPVNYFTQVC